MVRPAYILAGIPVEGKSSVCLICIKYRIIILIIIIISLVKYLHRILQTHHTRTHACAHAHAWTHTPVAFIQVIAKLGGAQP